MQFVSDLRQVGGFVRVLLFFLGSFFSCFCVMFCRSFFCSPVLFILAIALSTLQFMASDLVSSNFSYSVKSKENILRSKKNVMRSKENVMRSKYNVMRSKENVLR